MKKALLPMLVALALPAAAPAATITGGPAQLTGCAEYPCTLPVGPVPAGSTVSSFSATYEDASYVQLELQQDGSYEDSSAAWTTGAGVYSYDTWLEVPSTGAHAVALKLYEGAAANIEVTYEPAAAPTASPTPDPSTTPEPTTTPTPHGFAIDRQAVLAPDARGIEVFTSNELDKEIDGKISVTGEKGSGRIWHYDYHSREDLTAPIGRALSSRILKRGRATVTVVAKTTGGTFTQKVTVIRGGASGYDGTYRGTSGLVFVVRRGVITAISQPLSTFCVQTGQHIMRTMQTGLGMPALIARNGAFDHKASASADSFTYRGRLTRSGRAKGYNSLWYSTFGSDPVSGNIRAVSCFQASNWTAVRR